MNESMQKWCDQILEKRGHAHRKIWEWCFISQALYERNMLRVGTKGLGFAVGQEPLVSLFAKYGCKILATDLDIEKTADSSTGWIKTNEHSDSLKDLNRRNICEEEKFNSNAKFMYVDMTDIPKSLKNYDFCWSACAFEHLGSIQKGKQFIYDMIECLKPGGIAVHTTEYNVSSNIDTVDNNCDVLFRRCDFEEIADNFKSKGHKLELTFSLGNTEYDYYIDKPPYKHDPHLKFQYGDYISTSYGLIIKKKEKMWKRFLHFNNL